MELTQARNLRDAAITKAILQAQIAAAKEPYEEGSTTLQNVENRGS
jgi:hypothetical protein